MGNKTLTKSQTNIFINNF